MSQTKAQLIDAIDGSIVTADIADDGVNADKLASNSVVSASIVDGSIVNADINASAAIAGSKISPVFGNQGITSTNSITLDGSVGDTIIKSSGAEIEFTRAASSNITCSNASGSLNLITGGTNTRMSIASAGTVDIAGNLDVGAGVDVTGNITATGDATISGGDLTVTGTNPIVHLTDTNDNSDFQLNVNGGVFQVYDYSNSTGRLAIASTGDQTFTSTAGNASFTFKKGNAPSGEQSVTVKFDRNGTVLGGVGAPTQMTGGSGGDMGLFAVNGNTLRFGTGTGGVSTEKVSIDQNGHMYITDGNLVISTAGHGIDFSATADGGGVSGTTMANELLNDYEEGSFTGGFNDFNGSYSNNTGQYVKIGNFVCATIMIQGSGGSGSGDLKLTNLPFVSDGVTIGSLYRSVGNVFGYQGLVTGGLEISAIITNNTSHAILVGTNNNAVATTLNRNGLNSTAFEIQITVTYHTNS